MASGQVLEKLRNYYANAEGEVKKWGIAQERLVSLLGTITNILGRVPALQSPASYGEIVRIPDYPRRLLSKQLAAVEALMGDAQAALRDMAAAVQALERTFRNAERTMQQDKRLTPAARAVAAGPVPSVNQCLQGLEHAWRMHAQELALQQALAAQVRYGRGAEELAAVVAAAAARPNIEAERLRDAFHVMAVTAEVRV